MLPMRRITIITRPHGSDRDKLISHGVEITVPPDCLSCHLNELHDWAIERCGETGYTIRPNRRFGADGGVELLVFCFAEETDADAFFERFGSGS